MKHFIFSILLVLLPTVASADAVEIDGIWYDLITKAQIAHVAPNPSKYVGDIVIPSKISYNAVDYDVVSIEGHAFYTCHGLISLVIPASVTSIGYEAFWHCDNMKSLTICGCIKSSESGAFSYCKIENLVIMDLTAWCNSTFLDERDNVVQNPLPYCNHIFYKDEEIKNLIIPDDVISISDNAFWGCKSLLSLIIPNSVTSIGSSAFNGCSNLTSVTLSNGLKYIGPGAFCNCENLTSITIPKSVTEIVGGLFQGCCSLKSIIVEDGNAIYDSRDDCNAIIETAKEKLIEGCKSTVIPSSVTSISTAAFCNCSGLTSITIPNGVISIGVNAFYGCTALTSVTIGSNVTQIDYSAFGLCRELKDIYCYANNVPITEKSAFIDSYIEYANLYVPNASVNLYKAVEPWKNFGNIVAISGDTPETNKCAIPSISYQKGKLTFVSETEGANCHYTITDDDIKSGNSNELQLGVTYHISVYATKAGYENSDVAIATLYWIDVEPKSEGITNAVASVRAMAVLIQNSGNMLTVSGAEEGTTINVFDMSGRQVGSAKATSDATNINTTLRSGDIGIVKIGDKTVKVLMK